MTASEETAEIAEELLTALRRGSSDYGQALASRWDNEAVDLSHEPPLPMDGMKTREQMLGHRSIIDEAFRALMTDFHYADIDAKVIGNVIFVFYEQRGTLPDGNALRSPLCTRIQIEGGLISCVKLTIDVEANATLTEAFEHHVQERGLGEQI